MSGIPGDHPDLFAVIAELLGYRRKAFWDVVAPGRAERFSLVLAASGVASIAAAVVSEGFQRLSGVFLLIGALLVPVSSLLYLLSGAVRDVRTLWKVASDPAKDLDASFWVFRSCVAELRTRSEVEVKLALAFVIHLQAIVRSRSGFFAGAIDHVGVLPLAIAAWWAWRVAGGPTDFSIWEMGGLGFAAGVHFGLLLIRSRLDMLARMQCVLQQSSTMPDSLVGNQLHVPPKSSASNRS